MCPLNLLSLIIISKYTAYDNSNNSIVCIKLSFLYKIINTVEI